ncbi:DUF2332 domain-containing protein [Microbacterium sp. SLBN-146]|uniref:DUF2332 domain-containing protein n=1 Tax=Microbacterium sp. SLBN-146 TaxID=2768457 RepID=UPI001151CFF4|nr:DUF2332 domain-containing protein [Microbacterium sp. SLBN-146]TQJ32653.1 uncharacterized protein DUF2332 [Microbacterium sp. SLBN-146]
MIEAIAAYYDDFGRRWAHGTSPLYEEWALGIARDERMLARIAPLEPRLRQANLLFAAARWAGCPLAPYPEWSAWVTAHWDDVMTVASARATQTNEPGRCATLLPVLSRIDGPVALLEVGAAAGLCLLPDRYSVVYEGPSGAVRLDPVAGPPPFVLECRIDDEALIPDRMPEIVWRRGIDLRPIDPSDPDAVEWLATLIWPGPHHDSRVARLRGAAAVAASDPPRIERGDLLERLAEVARESPPDATLVVYHSAVLLYLSQPDRERFADLVRGLGAAIGRRVRWLSNETTGTFASVDAQLPAEAATDHRFVQTVDGRVVALAGQHGATYETRGLGA